MKPSQLLEEELKRIQYTFEANEIFVENNEYQRITKEINKEKMLLEKEKLSIGIKGPSNAGKSTFMNAIVEKKLLPMSKGQETSCVVLIRYENIPKPQIWSVFIEEPFDPTSSEKKLTFYNKKDFICEGTKNIYNFISNKNTELRNRKEKNVEEYYFIIAMKIPFFQDEKFEKIRNLFQLVDIPGVNDNQLNINSDMINLSKIMIPIILLSVETYDTGDVEKLEKILDEETFEINSNILGMFPEYIPLMCYNKLDIWDKNAPRREIFNNFIKEKFEKSKYQQNFISAKEYFDLKTQEKKIQKNPEKYKNTILMKELENVIDSEDEDEGKKIILERAYRRKLKKIEEMKKKDYFQNFQQFLELFSKNLNLFT